MVLMKKRRIDRTKCGSLEYTQNSESLSSNINSVTITAYNQVIIRVYIFHPLIKESHREGIKRVQALPILNVYQVLIYHSILSIELLETLRKLNFNTLPQN